MYWERFGRNRSWLYLRYYRALAWRYWGKPRNPCVRIADLWILGRRENLAILGVELFIE
jgi:hypothetical protein